MHLVTWENISGGQIVWLYPPTELVRHFPDRLRELRRGFIRFFHRQEDGAVEKISLQNESVGMVLTSPILPASLLRLERKLANRLFRPLSGREAAQFLGLDKKKLREMRDRGGIKPCGSIAANRYGRTYSYPVFAVADLVRIRDLSDGSAPKSQVSDLERLRLPANQI